MLEAWIGIDRNTGQQAIIVNVGHPSWKIADGLSLQARAEHVRIYHMLRVIINTLVKEAGIENSKEIEATFLEKWYTRYVKV